VSQTRSRLWLLHLNTMQARRDVCKGNEKSDVRSAALDVATREYSAGLGRLSLLKRAENAPENEPMTDFTLKVNGSEYPLRAGSDESLLTVLRDRLQLTGTKYGCGEGQCGACTVLLDGESARACLTLASGAAGQEITTIEGLERNGELHPVQQAFLEEGAFQCAYCTSGMIMTATGLLHEHPHPSDEQILDAMNGNICRCGAYPRILAAIHRAAQSTPKEADDVRP
jgi:aerobic-type carbon monoxide dehydrogenase small subunit (CoxS/CutS family)